MERREVSLEIVTNPVVYSDECAATLRRIQMVLGELPGVTGLVLGGSRARGVVDLNADIDIGLYYYRDRRPDFPALLAAARRLDDRGQPDGYGEYGEWGPWINGGVWLRVDGFKTDILLREAERVTEVIEACRVGKLEMFYQPGHPHAFFNSIYAGEVFHNVVLYDPDRVLHGLRSLVDPYPPQLKEAIIQKMGWESRFSLDTAETAAKRGDVAYVCGCVFRCIACLIQVVFALNDVFLLNEKGAVVLADRMSIKPTALRSRLEDAVSRLSTMPGDSQSVIHDLVALHSEVMALAER